MFWDLVIMGNEEALRPGGAKGHLYAPLAAALAQQRFMNDKAIRASAEHGLYHFSRIMPSEGPRGRHP